MVFNLLIACTSVVVITVIAIRVVARYRAAEGTTWERVKQTAEKSATLGVGYISAVGSSAVALASDIAQTINWTDGRAWIEANLPTKYVGFGILLLVLIFIAARVRSIIAARAKPVDKEV
jgi:hypothetical protein